MTTKWMNICHSDQGELAVTTSKQYGLGLYGGLPPHQRVDTSREAAISMLPHVGAQQTKVLEFLEARGERGATDEEIEHGIGMLRQGVCGRRNELVKRYLVKFSGKYRTASTGRRVRVWVAVNNVNTEDE